VDKRNPTAIIVKQCITVHSYNVIKLCNHYITATHLLSYTDSVANAVAKYVVFVLAGQKVSNFPPPAEMHAFGRLKKLNSITFYGIKFH